MARCCHAILYDTCDTERVIWYVVVLPCYIISHVWCLTGDLIWRCIDMPYYISPVILDGWSDMTRRCHAILYHTCDTERVIWYDKMEWNESGFRPPFCTYRLNWARRTSWGWWDDWDDTVLQTQDSKFEPWRSEAEHAISRSQRLPTILTFTRGRGRNIFCFSQTAETGDRTPSSGVKGSSANHYPRAPTRSDMTRRCRAILYHTCDT